MKNVSRLVNLVSFVQKRNLVHYCTLVLFLIHDVHSYDNCAGNDSFGAGPKTEEDMRMALRKPKRVIRKKSIIEVVEEVE